MDEKNPHEQHLDRHHEWYSSVHPEHRSHWTAYDDDYWGAQKARAVVSVQGDNVAGVFGKEVEGNYDLYGTQTNRVRPDVTSKMASLYYNGIQTEVTSDELPAQGDTREAVSRRVKAVEALLRRWTVDADLDDEQARLLTMALLYKGGCAMRLEVVPPDARLPDQKAMDLIRPCPVPPWEGVWDRRVRTKRLPYIGHYRQERIDTVRALAGGSLPEQVNEKCCEGLADVVDTGFSGLTVGAEDDKSYLWVLTLDDFCESVKIKAKGKSKEVVGKRTHYVALENELLSLNSGPVPYTDTSGYPVSDMVELIVEPVPQRPHDSIAPVASVYEPNSELNIAQSILAGQIRRDAARVIVTEETDEETLGKITRARDLEVVPVKKGNGLLSQKFHLLDTGTSSENMAKYVQDVREGLDDVRTTSDFSRGKAGQYMKAETTQSLVEYDRRTLGRMRKASDKMLSKLFQRFLRVLAVVMEELKEKSIKVVIDVPSVGEATKQETYELKPEHLNRRYKIQIIDSASTPGLNAERLATFQGSLDAMAAQVATAAPPIPPSPDGSDPGGPSPEMKVFAQMAFDHMASLGELPSQFNWANIQASAPAPETPEQPSLPPAAEEIPVEQAPPVPQEEQLGQEQLMEAPLAGAIMDAAEGGM